jgi:hypothetical protein
MLAAGYLRTVDFEKDDLVSTQGRNLYEPLKQNHQLRSYGYYNVHSGNIGGQDANLSDDVYTFRHFAHFYVPDQQGKT